MTEAPGNFSTVEWQTRIDLAICYRLIALFGMTDLISNHVSARIPGTEDFLLNPCGMLYEEITASSLIRVNLAGHILYNPHRDYGINKAGYVIHSAVHEARPDVGCVVHTHTPAGTAVSALECGVLMISQSAMRFANVAYHDFEGVAVDEEEKQRLVADLGHSEAMVLRNHGLLACGETIAQTFNNIYRLERICQIQLLAMSANSPLIYPSAEIVERSKRQYAGNVVAANQKTHLLGEAEWPAMRRMIDIRNPGYDT